jgi:carbonic anhydrase/acetyltransferase-like protein (isoleucine patch superfamily)
MGFYEFEGKRPKVMESAFVHPKATVMGGVTVGEAYYVGAGAVLQRDWGHILIVPGSNVQENRLILGDTDIPGGKMVLLAPGRIDGDVSEEQKAARDLGLKPYQELPIRCERSLGRSERKR